MKGGATFAHIDRESAAFLGDPGRAGFPDRIGDGWGVPWRRLV